LGDNYRSPNTLLPLAHTAAQTPIQMWVDNVTIFNEPWYSATNTSWTNPADPALHVLTPGKVYETSYLNRVAQNEFWYNGVWTTAAVAGGFVDRAALAGSTMLFRTSGASGMVLYVTPLAASGPIQICARPINPAAPASLEVSEQSHCQNIRTSSTPIAGVSRYALPFRFVDSNSVDNGEYVVSIETLENAAVQIDAVELFNVTAHMQPGVYESSSPFLEYSEFTPFDNAILNGGFAGTLNQVGCAPWTTDVVAPGSARLTAPFVDGNTACNVNATTINKGIESPQFTLKAGTKYTLVARVYVTAGSVRMRSTQPIGLGDMTATAIVPASPATTGYYTLRQEFTANAIPTALRFESVGSTARFLVDGVWLVPQSRGQWDQIALATYSGATAMRSQTPGASVAFSFTGTGFSVKMPTDAVSGEVEICYGAAVPNKCFTHQQDSAAAVYDVNRVIAGLPLGNYNVLITEKSDGMSASVAGIVTPRATVGFTIDSVTIFGESSLPADVTEIGQYEQNAVNSSGSPYLAKLPTTSWRDFAAATWSGGTASQVTTPTGLVSTVNAGATVIMSLSDSIVNPTVIVHNRVTTPPQSTTLLICATSNTIRSALLPISSVV
jgi:hypothetical protein